MQCPKLLPYSFREFCIPGEFGGNLQALDHITSRMWMHKDSIGNISNISFLPDISFMSAKETLKFCPISPFRGECTYELSTCWVVAGNLSFDQRETYRFYFTFCLSSSQLAHSWRDSFQDFSLFQGFCYLLHTATQDIRAINQTLFVVHPYDRLQNGNNV